MLPRSQRISVEQFNVVMEKGKIIHSPLFLMRILKINDSTGVAAVVSKKISKTAVGRNKLRRKMYEAIAPLFPVLAEGFHIIVFAKEAAVKAEFSRLSKEIKEIFVKAGLLK